MALLAAALERADLLMDARFATKPDRVANAAELTGVLDGVFATRDRADWRARLNARGIIFDIVATPDDVASDRQLHENGILVPFVDAPSLTISSPIALRGESKRPPSAPPALGEHTDQILAELGFTETEIEGLRSTAAVV